MKTTFTKLLLFLVLPVSSFAQITVTSSDFPVLNDVWYEYHDNATPFTIGAASSSAQTWDFSNFTVESYKISTFALPSTAPASWAAAFPSAQMVNYSAADSVADFFKFDTNGFYFDGSIDSTTQNSHNFDFNPDFVYLPTPFTLGSSRTQDAKFTIIIPGTGYTYKLILFIHQAFSADAFGAVTTPSGIYNNTLRIKTFSYKEDSAYIDLGAGYQPASSHSANDTTISYNWWKNGSNSLVFVIDEAMNGTVGTGVSSQATFYSASPNPLAVNNISSTELDASVYPNPAGASQYVNFTINNTDARNVTIFNSNGQIIKTAQISGKTKFMFDTEVFASGIYMYNITDSKGATVKAGKFSIVK